MATSLAIAVFAKKKYRCEALAQLIAKRTQELVVPLTRPDSIVLNRCRKILIDSDMNLQSELELIHTITVQNPHAMVVVLGSAESAEDIAKFAEAGACGYVPADADFEEMLAIVLSAAIGEFICPPRESTTNCFGSWQPSRRTEDSAVRMQNSVYGNVRW